MNRKQNRKHGLPMTAGRLFLRPKMTSQQTGPAPRPDFSALDKQRAEFYIMPYKPRNGDLRHFPGNWYTPTSPRI